MSSRRPRSVSALLATAVIATALAPREAAAQAWIRPSGELLLGLGVSHLSGDRVFGTDFVAREIVTPYQQTSVALYGELGLVDRWLMLTLRSELFRRNALVDAGATQGLGDARIGLWSGLLEAPFRLSIGLNLGLPLGDPQPSAGPGADDDAELTARSLPTGDGELDLEPTLVLGHSFGGVDWPLRHFATARAGYWLRTAGFGDALSWQLELGTKLPLPVLDRVWWVLRLGGVESLASRSEVQSGFAGLGDGVSYTAVAAQAIVEVGGGVSLTAGVDTALRARGIIAAAPLSFGLLWQP